MENKSILIFITGWFSFTCGILFDKAGMTVGWLILFAVAILGWTCYVQSTIDK